MVDKNEKLRFLGRALHFVLKIGDRAKNATFFRDILGMQILRHEEFQRGCEAQCNGAYDNRWSKTMVGYGPEDEFFVLELTYNYPVKSYKLGDDFHSITIRSSAVMERVKNDGYPYEKTSDGLAILSPDGYPFHIIDNAKPINYPCAIFKVTLASKELTLTIKYWRDLLGMTVLEQRSGSVLLGFGPDQARIEFVQQATIDHAEAYGRIAFSVPTNQLKTLQQHVLKNFGTILTELVCLETPGKASVSVVILADPDGHEICFVGDEGFRELSQVDPEAGSSLDKYIRLDKS